MAELGPFLRIIVGPHTIFSGRSVASDVLRKGPITVLFEYLNGALAQCPIFFMTEAKKKSLLDNVMVHFAHARRISFSDVFPFACPGAIDWRRMAICHVADLRNSGT